MWWFFELLAALAASSEDHTQQVRPDQRPASIERSLHMLTYRTRDGSSFFRFRFTPLGGDIRVHILEFPNPSVGSCHVLHDSQGPYICWSAAIRSMAAAKTVAAMWAEATLVYQRTGRTF